MENEEIAYLAGLLEGEGCFGLTSYGRSSQIQVAMTDREPLEAVARITGVGKVRGPYQRTNSKNKPFFSWAISDRVHVKRICDAVYPWMSPRRKQKIDSLRYLFEIEKNAPLNPEHKNHKEREDPFCPQCRNNKAARKCKRRKNGATPRMNLSMERGWLT